MQFSTLFSLFSVGFAARSFYGTFSGKATFYGDSSEAAYEPPPTAKNPGACGTDYLPPDPNYYVAMNSQQYSQKVCGQCVEITNPANGKSTVSYITDECPTCSYGDLDLSIEAFADLVGSTAKARDLGILKINWKLVSCPAKYGPISSPYLSEKQSLSNNSSKYRKSSSVGKLAKEKTKSIKTKKCKRSKK